jgi:hypothetical protein
MTQRTIVDWFAGRTRSPIDVVPDALRPFFGFEGQYLELSRRGRGWLGYESSADIRVLGANVGIAAWGGAHQKGWTHVSLSGSGCAWVQDWDRAQDSLQSLSGWENRRVDIALDTFARESSHESVLAAYRSGGFTTSGRPPKLQQIIGEDPADGRTIYIGVREGDKFLRCYEKGRQLAAGQPGLTHIDGVPVADWYRVEAELKVKDRPLPGVISIWPAVIRTLPVCCLRWSPRYSSTFGSVFLSSICRRLLRTSGVSTGARSSRRLRPTVVTSVQSWPRFQRVSTTLIWYELAF